MSINKNKKKVFWMERYDRSFEGCQKGSMAGAQKRLFLW